MFDYDLELKKFKPAVGVEIGEDELFSRKIIQELSTAA